MNIYFEQGLKEEALFIENAVFSVYQTTGILVQEDRSRYLRYNQAVGGYEPGGLPKMLSLTLTAKDLFNSNSISAEDDYLYGFANQCAWVSVCRLRSKNDRPVLEVEIDEPMYSQRLEHVAIHELGHIAVRDQKHFREYIITNKTTRHQTNTGEHCTDKRCVMSQFDDLKFLDEHIDKRYPKYFCLQCQASIRIS